MCQKSVVMRKGRYGYIFLQKFFEGRKSLKRRLNWHISQKKYKKTGIGMKIADITCKTYFTKGRRCD